jgi:hypothetical protein
MNGEGMRKDGPDSNASSPEIWKRVRSVELSTQVQLATRSSATVSKVAPVSEQKIQPAYCTKTRRAVPLNA